MGYYVGTAAEILIILIIGAAQWQIGRAAYAYAKLNWSPKSTQWLRLVLVASGIILVAGLIFNLPDVRPPSNAGIYGWLPGGALMWGFATTAAWIIYLLVRFFRAPTQDPDPTRRAMLRGAGAVVVAAPFAVLGYGTFVERTAFRVHEVDVPVPDLHKDLQGLRLVQLSDIHLSPFLSEQEFARVVDACNELRPHVALVTGDLISNHGDPLDACLRQISRLRSDTATLCCLGNHEVYARAEGYAAEKGARLGVSILRGEAQQLRFGDATLNIGGVDYQKMSQRAHYLDGAEQMLTPGACNVLLSHNPDVFAAAAQQGWDLTASGHTHGGQINVEILHQNWNVARFYTPYVYGLYRSGRSSVYVSRGIGTIGMPTRLGAPPEIAVLRLRKA